MSEKPKQDNPLIKPAKIEVKKVSRPEKRSSSKTKTSPSVPSPSSETSENSTTIVHEVERKAKPRKPSDASSSSKTKSSTHEASSPSVSVAPTGFKRRETVVIQSPEPTEIFTLAYSPDSRFLAAGCGDGVVRVFNATNTQCYTMNPHHAEALPTTCIRFRPGTNSKTKYVMLVANADGTVAHWHTTSETCIWTIKEEDNQIYTNDYRDDGLQFVTAGRDTAIRVYDESTKTMIHKMSAGGTRGSHGHSNRVYASKYHPQQPNIVLTGGWDNTVQIWDIRTGYSIRSIYGPHICGEGLDISDDGKTILTASWRPLDALQLWDFESGKLMETIEWERSQYSSYQHHNTGRASTTSLLATKSTSNLREATVSSPVTPTTPTTPSVNTPKSKAKKERVMNEEGNESDSDDEEKDEKDEKDENEKENDNDPDRVDPDLASLTDGLSVEELTTPSLTSNGYISSYDGLSGAEKVEVERWSKRPEKLYCGSFYRHSAGIVAAGGSGTNQAKLINMKSQSVLDQVTLSKGVYTLAFSPDGRKCAVGGGDPTLHVCTLY